jgi:hypothetical protein
MTPQEQLLQNLAAESDPRTTAVDFRWWEAIRGDTALYDKDWPVDPANDEFGLWIKVRFEVCPACKGRGKYVNPSIDAHGLGAEDFEDEDFAEGYRRGDYDVRCVLCEGEKVVPVPLEPEFQREIELQARDRADSRAEQLAEMRMGA